MLRHSASRQNAAVQYAGTAARYDPQGGVAEVAVIATE
jgi:hypothetical protein